MNKTGLALAMSSALFLAQATAAEASTTLRLATFWPSGSEITKGIIDQWADTIAEASNGELEVQVFPSETLAKADQSYQATVNGIADITVTTQGYTAGRFPLTQVVELPGISNSSTQGSCVAQTLLENAQPVADEYRDSHVLFMFTTGPGFISTRDTTVKTPDDLAGLRIRRPTSVVGELLDSLGAQPVGMPGPEMYTSVQRGVIDGVTLPWEGLKTFHLNELAHYHTVMPLYSMAFVATMNQRSYERLPADLKKVIDDNSGMKWALKAGAVFDQVDQQGREESQGENHHILEVANPLDDPNWGPPLKQATRKYLEDLKDRNLPAEQIYQQAQAASTQCESA